MCLNGGRGGVRECEGSRGDICVGGGVGAVCVFGGGGVCVCRGRGSVSDQFALLAGGLGGVGVRGVVGSGVV